MSSSHASLQEGMEDLIQVIKECWLFQLSRMHCIDILAAKVSLSFWFLLDVVFTVTVEVHDGSVGSFRHQSFK